MVAPSLDWRMEREEKQAMEKKGKKEEMEMMRWMSCMEKRTEWTMVALLERGVVVTWERGCIFGRRYLEERDFGLV